MRALLVLLAVISYPTQSQSQDLFVSAGGPYGGTVTGVLVAADGAWVAGSDNGAYRSTDQGLSWVRSSVGLPITSVLKLERLATGTLLAGTVDAGIYRSVDDGRSWVRVNAEAFSSYVWGIATRRSDALIVIAASDDGYVSVDDGQTWTPLGFGLGPYAVAVDSLDRVSVIVDQMLLRSTTPLAGNWDTATVTSTDTPVILLSVAADGSMIAGTEGDGLHRSTDGGSTWQSMIVGSNMEVPRSVRTAGGNNLLATADGGVIYRSTDNGVTWVGIGSGFQVVFDCIAIDTALVASTSDGIHQTVDLGATWTQRSTGIEAAFISVLTKRPGDETIVAGTHNGLMFSTPGDGQAWTRIPFDRPYYTSVSGIVFPPSGSIMVSAYGEGVLWSGDSGATWTRRWSTIPTTALYGIIITDAGSILVGADSGRVYRSTDEGMTWELSVIDTSVLVLAMTRDSIGRVWAGTSSMVYRSDDDGRTWTPSTQGITATYIGAMATGPDGTLYAGSYNGNFFSSIDSGATWRRGTIDPSAILVVALAVDEHGVLFAGIINRAVFRSTDRGLSWTPYRSGITSYSTYALVVDRSGHLYAGTAGSGAFRSVDKSSSAPPSSGTAETIDAIRIVPTPVRHHATLLMTVDRSAVATGEVVALDGRTHRALFTRMVGPGEVAIPLHLNDLPAGVWMIRVTVGGQVRTHQLVVTR